MGKQILLNAFDMNTPGHQSNGLWRHPRDQSHRYTSLAYWQDLARTLERGLFDGIFLADVTGVYDVYGGSPEAALRACVQVPTNDPFTLVPAMAAVTEHLGFGVTGSLSYEHPYPFARQYASLDHMSGGRIGWNIVTTWSVAAAANFGDRGQVTHADRYDRAEEYVAVAKALWDSWADDAILDDRATGRYARGEAIRPIAHHGPHYSVAGPLNIPRPPQGRPVLVQASSSETGRRFAARHAEAIFTAHLEKATARQFYADIKRLVGEEGRRADQVLVLPGLSAMLGSTEAEAQRLAAELDDLSDPEVGRRRLSGRFGGFDFSHLPLDKPLSPEDFPDPESVQAARSRTEVIVGFVRRERPTLRQLLSKLAGARGHFTFAATPEQLVEMMVDWHGDGAADGFNLMPPVLPWMLDVFIAEVVPRLQRKGLFRTEYTGRTLRDHYGPDRPAIRRAT